VRAAVGIFAIPPQFLLTSSGARRQTVLETAAAGGPAVATLQAPCPLGQAGRLSVLWVLIPDGYLKVNPVRLERLSSTVSFCWCLSKHWGTSCDCACIESSLDSTRLAKPVADSRGFGIQAGELSNQLIGWLQTWLILPVVICLSQRLSHACLSISSCTVKLRMAH
jgi:hypothetical protein